MGRWLVGMSGDKDAMIAHLENCEKRKIEQFAEIREIADNVLKKNYQYTHNETHMRQIIALCDVFLDKRSDKQKMQDQIDEMQKTIEGLMEEKREAFFERKEKEKQLRSDIGESLS
jgi:uncharacterized protein YpuA (DUF1002 family)